MFGNKRRDERIGRLQDHLYRTAGRVTELERVIDASQELSHHLLDHLKLDLNVVKGGYTPGYVTLVPREKEEPESDGG